MYIYTLIMNDTMLHGIYNISYRYARGYLRPVEASLEEQLCHAMCQYSRYSRIPAIYLRYLPLFSVI